MTITETTLARQKAIDVLLRLMGCTDAKQSNCEHVAAITALSEAIAQSTFELLDRACGGILTEVGLVPRIEAHFRPSAEGKREGRLR